MVYREIWVRPVVRYVITDYTLDDEQNMSASIPLGALFENSVTANAVAELLVHNAVANGGPEPVFEPARALKIEWSRGPGEPKEAIRWEIVELEDRPKGRG